jgi:hypothetical protein
MDVIRDALRFPKNRENGWTNPILIGSIVNIAGSAFILPYPFVLGYYIKTLRTTLHGDPNPPIFEDWKGLYIDGLKGSVIVLLALFIPILIGSVLLAAITDPITGGSSIGAMLGVLVILALLSSVFWFVVPASLGNMALTGKFRSAVDLPVILDTVTSKRYITYWLLGTGIFFGFFVLYMILFFIPIVNFVAIFGAPFAVLYVTISAFYLYGRGFALAQGITPDDITITEVEPQPSATPRQERGPGEGD